MEKLNFALTPTPLEYLKNVSEKLGIKLWMKRDDLTGDIVTGGNKIRKLEYILADAKKQGADTIITTGGLQSNHIKITAGLAVKLGMKPILLLNGEKPAVKKANTFLDSLLNAELRYITAENQKAMNEQLKTVAHEVKESDGKPYVIPVGGSTGLGSLGYVAAYEELSAQTEGFDWEFACAGSGGTLAGIYLGHRKNKASSKVIGVSPWLAAPEITQQTIDCIKEGQQLLEGTALSEVNLTIDDQYIGEGYGIPTKAGKDAIKLLMETEGILLDHVYTAKTMACLLDYVKTGKIKPGESVLFWHTGGAPGIFAIADQWKQE